MGYTSGAELEGELGLDFELFGQTLKRGVAYSRTYSAEVQREYVSGTSDSARYLPYASHRIDEDSAQVDEIHWTTR